MRYLILALFLVGCGEDKAPVSLASQYQGRPLSEFQEALVNYYGPKASPYKICISNPDFCLDYYQLEEWVKIGLD